MSDQLRHWALKLNALAQTGLTYARDPYDRQRYDEIRIIAAEMVATQTGQDAQRIATLFALEGGYATPKVGVRAIVVDTDGAFLLVQERSDGHWCPPGGWADVGETPAAMAIREVREESGYDVAVERVLAVLDRDAQGHPPIGWHVYTVYLLCRVVGGAPRAPDAEITAVGWFRLDALPPLSHDRVFAEQLERFATLAADPSAPVWYD
jgi:ADP-ribose pyrophosphatase YjhB (NUDIX family)